MKTPIDLSPLLLIQELLRDEPWKLLCAVIMLNRTSAKQVWGVFPEFFDRWPNPASLLSAPDGEVAELIKPLGFRNRRTKSLKEMTKKFVEGFSEPEELPGIGKYGSDSYRMFVRGYIVQDATDKELRKYVEWANGREREGESSGHPCGDELGGVRARLREAEQVPRQAQGASAEEA